MNPDELASQALSVELTQWPLLGPCPKCGSVGSVWFTGPVYGRGYQYRVDCDACLVLEANVNMEDLLI